MYHVVSNESLKHIKHLYPYLSAAAFEKQIDQLLKLYQPVDLETFKFAVDLDFKNWNKPLMLLTFDDGLSELFHQVHPILRRKGLPATMFLNSNFIDNKDLFYRFECSLLIDRVIEISSNNQFNKKKNFLFNDLIKSFFNTLDAVDNDFIKLISKQLDVDSSIFLKDKQPYLSTNQVLTMMKEGWTIGSHSPKHKQFSLYTPVEQIKMVQTDADRLRELFNIQIQAFAFPFSDHGVSASTIEEIQKICPLTFGTGGINESGIPYHFQRVDMEQYKGFYFNHNLKYFKYIYSKILKQNNW